MAIRPDEYRQEIRNQHFARQLLDNPLFGEVLDALTADWEEIEEQIPIHHPEYASTTARVAIARRALKGVSGAVTQMANWKAPEPEPKDDDEAEGIPDLDQESEAEQPES